MSDIITDTDQEIIESFSKLYNKNRTKAEDLIAYLCVPRTLFKGNFEEFRVWKKIQDKANG